MRHPRHCRPCGKVIAFCRANGVDFVVVGPEAPLCAGIVDDLEAAGIKAFGPSRAAARLEGSKGFTKDLCRSAGIPTAAYERFRTAAEAKAYLHAHGAPIVVKADGLAAGKGVVVAESVAEAEAAIDLMSRRRLGEAGAELVIEEFLDGEEASFFALCDGETALPLASAQDHKRAFDGDKGPNTGGMGAYSPAPIVDAGDERARHGRNRSADPARHESDGRALQGRALCRTDDHGRGPEADRIQRALRRSGMPGADAAADVGPRAGAAGKPRRRAQVARSALVSGSRADGGDGGQGLSGRLREGLGDRRPRRSSDAWKAWKSSMPAPSRTAGASWPMADACSMSRRWARRYAKLGRAPTRPFRASAGPRAFAATTSAGARSREKNEQNQHRLSLCFRDTISGEKAAAREEHERHRPPEHLFRHQGGRRAAALRCRPPGSLSARARRRLCRADHV